MHVIDVARDFSPTPGVRYIADGDWSGEEFRESVLRPALEKHGSVVVDLDAAEGFSSSFLEEVFGGMVRILGETAFERVIPRAVLRPRREAKARHYMKRALEHTK